MNIFKAKSANILFLMATLALTAGLAFSSAPANAAGSDSGRHRGWNHANHKDWNRKDYRNNHRDQRHHDENYTDVSGKVTSVDTGNKTLKLEQGDKTYTVDTSSATIKSNNGKKIDLSDLSEGDKVTVHGSRNNDSHNIDADSVRDTSIS